MELDLTEVLGQVICPCSAGLGRPMSVTDMNIIAEVHETAEEVRVAVELTDPTCPFGLSIADGIERAVHANRGDRPAVRVSFVVGEDLWSEDRMDPAARLRLQRIRARDGVRD